MTEAFVGAWGGEQPTGLGAPNLPPPSDWPNARHNGMVTSSVMCFGCPGASFATCCNFDPVRARARFGQTDLSAHGLKGRRRTERFYSWLRRSERQETAT